MCCFLSFSVMSFVLGVLSSFTAAIGEICLFRPRCILIRMPAVWRGYASISVMDCDAYFSVERLNIQRNNNAKINNSSVKRWL